MNFSSISMVIIFYSLRRWHLRGFFLHISGDYQQVTHAAAWRARGYQAKINAQKPRCLCFLCSFADLFALS